jgi:hypothetical protein
MNKRKLIKKDKKELIQKSKKLKELFMEFFPEDFKKERRKNKCLEK